jgi:uncharacterized membrane protein YfcA
MPEFLSPHFGFLILVTFIASVASTSVGFGLGIILVSILQFLLPPAQIL